MKEIEGKEEKNNVKMYRLSTGKSIKKEQNVKKEQSCTFLSKENYTKSCKLTSLIYSNQLFKSLIKFTSSGKLLMQYVVIHISGKNIIK